MRECSLHTYTHVCGLSTEERLFISQISHANMCKVLFMSVQAQVPAEARNKDKPECRFRKLLASRWQVEFNKFLNWN